jgi:hypothetical protein
MDNPGLTEFFREDPGWSPDLLHLYPHGDRLVLGGIAQGGSWDLQPSREIAEAIIRRCASVDPRIASLPVTDHRVGLRSIRPAIRCEAEFAVKGFTEALIEDLRVNAPQARVAVVLAGHVGTDIVANSRRARGLPVPEQMSDAQLEELIPRAALIRAGVLAQDASAGDLSQFSRRRTPTTGTRRRVVPRGRTGEPTAGVVQPNDLQLWKLLEWREVEAGLGQKALEQSGAVLHLPEPGPDQRGQLSDVVLDQVGQGPFEV